MYIHITVQNPDLGPETHLECSDLLHIASGCTTGDYYELRQFQDHPSTFTHKNYSFGGAEDRLHLAIIGLAEGFRAPNLDLEF